jgi:hypothetical protein
MYLVYWVVEIRFPVRVSVRPDRCVNTGYRSWIFYIIEVPQNRFPYRSQNLHVLLDGWFTVHRSITLIDFQLDAQNSYFFIYNTFIKILYMFRALSCSSSGGLENCCIWLVIYLNCTIMHGLTNLKKTGIPDTAAHTATAHCKYCEVKTCKSW